MTPDDIKKVLHGSHPFTIRMVSGRAIKIPHPDFVALTVSNSSLLFSSEESLVEIIRLTQIESIEMHRDTVSS
jgi:hypothetical protein